MTATTRSTSPIMTEAAVDAATTLDVLPADEVRAIVADEVTLVGAQGVPVRPLGR